MGMFEKAPQSGIYAACRDIFKTLRDDQILCKYLYYPSADMDDDPTLKTDVTSSQKEEVFSITIGTDDLEGPNQIKRGRLSFGLGVIQKSYKNHKASRPTVLIYLYIPREGFQNIDFRLEAVIDRVDELISDRRFEGSFGRVVKDTSNPYDAPKGYVGFILRYGFMDTDF